MADQASIRVNGPASATGRMGVAPPGAGSSGGNDNGGAGPGDMVTSVAEFGENLLSLGELQARLAAIELKQNVEAVKLGGAVIVSGAVLAMVGLPIALAG